jgi:WD40 repeat protein
MKQRELIGNCGGQVSSLAVSSFGKSVVSGTYKGDVCVWDTKKLKQTMHKKFDNSIIVAVSFGVDAKTIFVSTSGGSVTALDAETGRVLWRRESEGGDVVAFDFVQTRDAVLTATSDYTVELLDATTGEVMESVRATGSALWDIVVFPNGKRFAAALADGTVGIWDLEQCSLIASFPASESIECIDVSSDGHRLAIGGGDATIQLMDGMSHGARLTNTKE